MTLVLTAAVGGVSFGAMSAEDVDVNVDETLAIIEQWVQTRRIISQEERDWVLAEEMLSDRIELVGHEIETVRENIEKAEASITEADRKLAEQRAENEQLEAAQASLRDAVTGLEARTQVLVDRLPVFVQERVRMLSQRLPDNPAETALELPDRFLNVIGILNDLNKFNREITVTRERRDLEDGTSAEVTTVYLGLGQAYYVGAQNMVAGVGTLGEDGWTWAPANDAAQQISDVIAILENEKPAAFVNLPIDVK